MPKAKTHEKKPKGPFLVVEKRTWQVQPGSPYVELDAAVDALEQRAAHDGRVGEDSEFGVFGEVAWGS